MLRPGGAGPGHPTAQPAAPQGAGPGCGLGCGPGWGLSCELGFGFACGRPAGWAGPQYWVGRAAGPWVAPAHHVPPRPRPTPGPPAGGRSWPVCARQPNPPSLGPRIPPPRQPSPRASQAHSTLPTNPRPHVVAQRANFGGPSVFSLFLF